MVKLKPVPTWLEKDIRRIEEKRLRTKQILKNVKIGEPGNILTFSVLGKLKEIKNDN